jgi:hypothetical protein
MKNILLATVAVVPLLATGTLTASSQDIKQGREGMSQSSPGRAQGREGMSQSSPGRAEGQENRSQAQGKEIQGKEAQGKEAQGKEVQGKSEAADKTSHSSGAQEKTQGNAQAKTEHDDASSNRAATANQDRAKHQANSESRKQPAESKAKQGSNESRSKAADRDVGTKTKQESNAGGQDKATRGNQKQANEPQKEPARTTGQANRPNQDNAERSKEHAQQNGSDENRGGEAGGRVTLNQDQRARIQRTVLSGRDAPRVDSVDFGVNIGVVVPSGIRISEVPSTLVEINPQWQGDEYFVVRDEIVIIDHSRRIVATVPVGSSSTSIETRTSSAKSGGFDIRRVQEILIEKGFYHGRVDGEFGADTKQALILFQRREGMEANGRIDERTSAALGVSGRTEGRAGQTEEKGPSNEDDQKQGQAEPKGQSKDRQGNQPSTSGQAGGSSKSPEDHSSNGQNDDAKSNNARDKDKSGQNDRSSTSGQAGRTPSAGEGQPGGADGRAMKPQNEPASPGNAGGAGDNQKRRD